MKKIWALGLCLCATLLHGAPKILYLLVEDRDPLILESAAKQTKQLEACGFEVLKVNQRTLKGTNEEVEKLSRDAKLQNVKLVWIDGHGHVNDYLEPSEPLYLGQSGTNFPAYDLIKEIGSKIKQPQIWLDTCYAGNCPPCDSVAGIGTSCAKRQEATVYAGDQINGFLIDLLCSGEKDCKLWREVDTDHDGIITPLELNGHFLKKWPGKVKKSRYWKLAYPENEASKKEEQKYVADCNRLKGTYSVETIKPRTHIRIIEKTSEQTYIKPLEQWRPPGGDEREVSMSGEELRSQMLSFEENFPEDLLAIGNRDKLEEWLKGWMKKYQNQWFTHSSLTTTLREKIQPVRKKWLDLRINKYETIPGTREARCEFIEDVPKLGHTKNNTDVAAVDGRNYQTPLAGSLTLRSNLCKESNKEDKPHSNH